MVQNLQLKQTIVEVVDHDICKKKYLKEIEVDITDHMFCAGTGFYDSCNGDSGGPAVFDNELIGIVANGRDCGSYYFPGLYVKVSSYFDWIYNTTGINFVKWTFFLKIFNFYKLY